MAFAGILASVLGSAIGAVGSIAAGNAAAAQAKYQSKVAEMNQKIAEDNARRAIDRSQVEQEDVGRNARALMGEQESAQAASGLNMFGRSQRRTRSAAAQFAMMDQTRTRWAGELEAYAHKTQASNYAAAADAAKMEAKYSQLGGYLNAASYGASLIGNLQGPFSNMFASKGTTNNYNYYGPSPIPKPRYAT